MLFRMRTPGSFAPFSANVLGCANVHLCLLVYLLACSIKYVPSAALLQRTRCGKVANANFVCFNANVDDYLKCAVCHQ